jgi:cell division ATPase FtsA
MHPAVSPAAQRLRAECRQAKETLSVDSDVTIPVLLPGINTTVRLTRSEFEELIRPSVGETVAALRRAARSAGLRMHEVARILLVGGSSRIPLVAELLRAETGRPVALDAHPKHAIALGAARSARDALSAGVEPAARRLAERTAPAVTPPAATNESAPSVALPSSYDVVDPTLVMRAPGPAPPSRAPQSLSARVSTPVAAILLFALLVAAIIVILR